MRSVISLLIVCIVLSGWAQEPTVTGIDREAVRQVIRKNLKSFEACYHQLLKRNSEAHGKIEIEWDIIEKGKVDDVSVASSSLDDAPFNECMVTAMKKLTFPAPAANQIARIKYPFVFTSADNAKSH